MFSLDHVNNLLGIGEGRCRYSRHKSPYRRGVTPMQEGISAKTIGLPCLFWSRHDRPAYNVVRETTSLWIGSRQKAFGATYVKRNLNNMKPGGAGEKLLQVRIPVQQRRELRLLAAYSETTISKLVQVAIEKFLEGHRKTLDAAGLTRPVADGHDDDAG